MADSAAGAAPSAAAPDAFAAAIEQIRSSVKWLIATFGAVGALLVAGVQLKDVGQLHGDRLIDLIVWFAVGVAGVIVAILAAARVLSPVDGTMQALRSSPDMAKVRRAVTADSTLLQHQARSLPELLDAYDGAIVENREAWRAVQPDTPAGDDARKLAQATQDRQRSLGTTVGFLMRLGVYLRIQQLFNQAKVWMTIGAVAAAAGAVGVAYYAKPAKEPKKPAAVKAPTYVAPSVVRVSLTPVGIRTLQGVIGAHCRSSRIRAVVVGGTMVRPDIVTLPSASCRAVRLALSRSVGVATASAP